MQKKLMKTSLNSDKLIQQFEISWHDNALKNLALMKHDCMLSGRCPVCTMVLPCSHFANLEKIIEKGWFTQQQWVSLPHKMRNVMVNLKKELSGKEDCEMIDSKRDLSRLQGMNQAL